MRSIEDCPLEIWREIFDFACLDDGYTARSLSQVSRHIRYVSEGHRYRSVKISSSAQLVKFEQQFNSGTTGTRVSSPVRFLSVVLPTWFVYEAYPEEEMWVPEDESDGGSWDWSGDEGSDQWIDTDTEADVDEIMLGADQEPGHEEAEEAEGHSDSADSEPSESDSLYEYQEIDDDDMMACQVEAIDIAVEKNALMNERDSWRPPISDVMDLIQQEDPPTALNKHEYAVYGALRRLLEACAQTLEVFSLYYAPGYLIPHDVMIPPLPRLRSLSLFTKRKPPGYMCRLHWRIGNLRGEWNEHGSDIPILFPSLELLRVAGSNVNWMWWDDIIRSGSKNFKIVASRELERSLRKPMIAKRKGHHIWEATEVGDKDDEDDGLIQSVKWWLEDIVGHDI